MKLGPLVASGLAHFGVLWALMASDRAPVVGASDAGLIQFEPVSQLQPEPEPEPAPNEPEPEPEPTPNEPEPAPTPSEPRRSAQPRPANPVDNAPESADPAGTPRRLDLTLSHADATGSPSGAGQGQGAGAAAAREDPPLAKPACKEPATKPQPIERVTIEYPARAQAMGLEGRLVLQANVDAKGAVGSVEVVESVGAEIDEPARAAMKRWRFEPATRCGKPVAARYVIAREFHLGD